MTAQIAIVLLEVLGELRGLRADLQQGTRHMTSQLDQILHDVDDATNNIAALVTDVAAKLDNNAIVLTAVRGDVDDLIADVKAGGNATDMAAKLAVLKDTLTNIQGGLATQRDRLAEQSSNLQAIGVDAANPVPPTANPGPAGGSPGSSPGSDPGGGSAPASPAGG